MNWGYSIKMLKNKNNKWSMNISSFCSDVNGSNEKLWKIRVKDKKNLLTFQREGELTFTYYLPWTRHRARFFTENLSNLSILQKKCKALGTWRTCWKLPDSQMQMAYLKSRSIEIATPCT